MKTTTSTPPRDRLYQAYWQDGLLDLFIGVSLLLIGIGWLLDYVTISAIAPAVSVPLWHATRVKIIQPRLGYVKFDGARRRQLKRAQLLLIALGVLSLVMGVLAFLSFDKVFSDTDAQILQHVIVGLPAMLIAFAGLLAGVLFALSRLITYGGIAALFALFSIYFQMQPGWPIFLSAMPPLLVGVWLLSRFLKQFPVLPEQLES